MNTRLLLIGIALSASLVAGCNGPQESNQPGPPPRAELNAGNTTQTEAVLASPLSPATPTPEAAQPARPARPESTPVKSQPGLKPTLLVATFSTDSDDDLPWGQVIGASVRQKLRYAPDEIVSMPSPWWAMREFGNIHSGAQPFDPYSVDEAVRIARVFDLAHVLTGRVRKRGDALHLTAALRDAASSKTVARFSLESTVAKAPAMISDCCHRVLDGLGIQADPSVRACLSRLTPTTGEMLQRGVRIAANEPTSAALAAAAWKELAAADPEFRYAKLRVLDKLDDVAIEDSLAAAKRFHEEDPDDGFFHEGYVAKLYGTGKYEQAVEEATALLDRNPNNLTVLWRMGLSYSASNQHAEAVAIGERLVELAPKNWWTHYMLGWFADRYGWHVRGGDYWYKVPPEGKVLFPRMMRRCGEEFEKARALNPNNPDVLAQLAGTSIQLGAPGSTIESLCRRAIAIRPDHWSAHTTLLLYYRPGYSRQHEKAMALCREAAEKNPESAEMQWLMADYLMWYTYRNHSATGIDGKELAKTPEFSKPIEASIQAAFRLNPNQRDWIARTARHYREMGDHETAWAYFSRVTDYVPRPFRRPGEEYKWWYHVAWAAIQTKHWDEALAAAQKGLKFESPQATRESLLLVVAWALDELKKVDEAIEGYYKVMKAGNSYLWWGHSRIAVLILEHRPDRLDEGFESAKRAVALKPNEAIYLEILARYHWRRGEKNQALERLGEVLAIHPDSKSALELKSKILGTEDQGTTIPEP